MCVCKEQMIILDLGSTSTHTPQMSLDKKDLYFESIYF